MTKKSPASGSASDSQVITRMPRDGGGERLGLARQDAGVVAHTHEETAGRQPGARVGFDPGENARRFSAARIRPIAPARTPL